MKATEVIRLALQTSLDWARGAASSMAETPLVHPTPRGGNHPMWVVGHSAYAEDGLLAKITGEPPRLDHWKPLFGAGTEPTAIADDYPPFEEVLAAFVEVRGRTLRLLEEIGDAGLDRPPARVPQALRDLPPFKSVGTMLTFIALHQMNHVGQLCDARRAAGRKWTN
ncbi:MAG: DinB family protein [Phycisphaerae bacterium]